MHFREQAEKHWERPWTGWLLWAIFLALCGYWIWHVPPVGYAVATLALAAAIMSAKDFSGFAKFCWVLLLFGLLFAEMKSITKDKKDTNDQLVAQFGKVLDQGNEHLRVILEDEHNNLRTILDNERQQFTQTINQLLRAQRAQTHEFEEVLNRQQQSFEREEQLTQFLNGKLVPASDPTPPTPTICGPIRADEFAVFIGNNVGITKKFPYTILAIRGKPVISIDRSKIGTLTLSVDMRDTSNRIIARLDKNGFVVGAAGLFMLRPDISTVIIEDAYGNEVLNARFANPHTFTLTGVLQYQGVRVPIQMPFMTNSCARGGSVFIGID